ncbi:MAG: FAD-dependent thymidylate synthase [Syntrophaceae bacterium]|nr:FAD-dependent thymidylate synthase [Syntrophaceae bacterium]
MLTLKVELLSITPNAEKLIEAAGRTSYLSFDKQGEETEKRFIRMLIKSGHLSVLEHAYATFRISGASRSSTHQLVRHRLCSFIQQSQRYVDESHFHYIEPDSIKNDPEAHSIFVDFMDQAKAAYLKLSGLKIKKEDARYVLPNAVESQIVVSANFRQWRHIIDLRGKPQSQWEIRKIAIEILRILKKHAPNVFGDFEVDEEKKIIRKV